MRTLILAFGAAVSGQAMAQTCDMSLAFRQPDEGGARTTAVLSGGPGSPMLFGDALNVNTDGSPRSYSVTDFWGEKTAINNLCNAMSDACAGLNQAQLKARRVLTQTASAQGWPAGLLAQSKLASNIVAFKNGKPCPEVNGFLVSATSLRKPGPIDVCNPANYSDSATLPGIVLPRGAATGFATRNAKIGDVAAVLSPDGSRVEFAVVNDAGPARQLGEISVGLAGRLIGKTAPPVNFKQIMGRSPFQGQSWLPGRTVVLVFPGTRDTAQPFMTPDRVEAVARPLFDAWGGLARLRACKASYRRDQ